jgi:hypothetical protein
MQQPEMSPKQQLEITRMLEHASRLENSLLEQQSEFKELGVKRKPCLPGFAGHRERCACALCKRCRTQHQNVITHAQTVKTHVQQALAAAVRQQTAAQHL